MTGSRILGALLLVLCGAGALLNTGCEGGHYRGGYWGSRTTMRSEASSGFVTGGGTITMSRTVLGVPVSGVSIGPDGTTIYSGTGYGYPAYGGYPAGYGYPAAYGTGYGYDGAPAYGYPAYGYPAYGYPGYGYGTYTRCSGAVACGADVSVTGSSWGTGPVRR